ncbi:MAG: PHP domain-containing protein [Candidatus Aminicenantes bacterium]|nr:PHP domain-containing protein [Candidatus Aminicenantes bacterium]
MFKADLHVHTCLSPCGDLEMAPERIALEARRRDISILGICDHNTAENTPALLRAGERNGVSVLPGLEVTSQEEVHILALFDRVESALEMQKTVYDHLPGENDEDAFGPQVVVNDRGEVLGFNPRLLIGATTLPLGDVVRRIHELDGLAIAAHVDRESYSLIGQLGLIPDDLDLDALEVSPRTTLAEARSRYGNRFPLTTASDAHFLRDIGAAVTEFVLEDGTVPEIRLALEGRDGRRLGH